MNEKETVSIQQAICIIILFIFGSTVVLGLSTDAGQDAWISLLLAVVLMIPILLVYARIMRLFPEKDLFDILIILFGNIPGKILITLMAWYALHLCALVLRNFSEFMQITMMQETPQLPLMAAMLLVTCYLSKSNAAVMGKWAIVMLPILFLTIIVTLILSAENMDFSTLQPIFAKDPVVLIHGAYQIITFPFAETVLFLCIANVLKRQDSPYKTYGWAIAISGFFLLAVFIRNLTVLGVPMVRAEYFPSYSTARILHIGDFLTRIEGTITMNFIVTGIVKIALCLTAASKGIAKLFNIQNHRQIILPVGLLALALCAIIYKSAMEMFGFLKYYQIYAIPFQIMIPGAAWIMAEIKTRKKRAAA